MRKTRLVGGRPALRRDLPDVSAAIAQSGVERVAMTTSGCLLQQRVDTWREAGLTRLNVSADALDRKWFAAITGHDR